MFAVKTLAVGSAIAVLLAMAAPAAQAGSTVAFARTAEFATAAVDGEASSDWSGWDVSGGTYTSVSASWTVPTVGCSPAETSYSADWVGLDGDGSNSVEQIGTSSDCDNGTPAYSTWYEFYPDVSVTLPNEVKAGDKISASVVAVAGSDRFTLKLTDSTQKWTRTQTGESPSGSGASAEIIAEAPSGSSRANSVLPLADFKSVVFSNVLVDGGKIGNVPSATKIAMIDDYGNAMATVSALTSADQFTVKWVSSGDSGGTAQSGFANGQGSSGSTVPQSDGSGGYGSGGYGSGGYGSGGYGSGATGDWGYSGWGDSPGYAYGYGYSYGDGYAGYSDDGQSLWSS